jgi:aminoglycoside phosphotransferase (APT) family kinase protein
MPADEDELLRERVRAGAAARFGTCGKVGLRPLEGGHSGLTWLADLATPAGAPDTAVVKSTPPGRRPVGRHDVLRQARVLAALQAAGGVSVPEVYFSDDADPPFFAMQRAEGSSAEPALGEDPGDASPETVAALWEAAVDQLVRLGRVDPIAIGLAQDGTVVGPAEEVERWSATARAADIDGDPRAVALAQGLAADVPGGAPPALVHGDYRLGNMLCSDGEIRALIDWEIWSVGDARCDLGWLLLFCEHGNFPGLGRAVAGTPEPEAVIASYAAHAGAAPERLDWFRALACFKLAGVQAHNLKRHREGRRVDPYLERFNASVDRLLDVGVERLEDDRGR